MYRTASHELLNNVYGLHVLNMYFTILAITYVEQQIIIIIKKFEL